MHQHLRVPEQEGEEAPPVPGSTYRELCSDSGVAEKPVDQLFLLHRDVECGVILRPDRPECLLVPVLEPDVRQHEQVAEEGLPENIGVSGHESFYVRRVPGLGSQYRIEVSDPFGVDG